MADSDLTKLLAALRGRGIKSMLSAPIEPDLTSISMSTYSAQEFLNALAPGPITEDDEMAVRMLGRPQDLGIGDVPWQYEAVPTIVDMESGLELRIIFSIPDADLTEILRRLGG